MPVDATAATRTVQLLGHHDYAVMLAPTGAGGSYWRGLAVTRWRPTDLNDPRGAYVYLRDVDTDKVWSATAAPCGGVVRYWGDDGLLRFARDDGAITTTCEVTVDSVRAVEVRRIGVSNRGPGAREVELTSYLELALAPVQADAAHPAYSKMFVQTAVEGSVLLAWRRKKGPAEPDVWAAHAIVVDGDECAEREWETDRTRFIGRDGSLAAPAAMRAGQRLAGGVGTVLDPIFSLRTRVRVEAGTTRRVAWVTAVAPSREEVVALIRSLSTPAACSDALAGAHARSPGPDVDAAAAQRLQLLVGALAGSDPSWRADPETIVRGEGGAPVLWAKGISGDLPIVLVKVYETEHLDLVQTLLHAQRYWRERQLPADVVVLDASEAGLGERLASYQGASDGQDKTPGSLFVLRAAELDKPLRDGLSTAASVVLDGHDDTLRSRLVDTAGVGDGSAIDWAPPAPSRIRGGKPASAPAPESLEFWNGLGGFAADGREYVTVLGPDAHTPAPWSHLVANPGFGFLVTTTGGGYCWALNSQQNQITAWSNDAVCDPPGDYLLLRDEDDDGSWSATAAPLRAPGATYVARFGAGYARFDARVRGIESELTQCVATTDPVKVSRLRLRNRSGRARRIAIVAVVEWMLGPIGGDPPAMTSVQADGDRGAVFARNVWRAEFTQATAFIACGASGSTLGSDGNRRSTVATTMELAPGASAERVFLLGEGRDRATAEALVDQYRGVDVDALLAGVDEAWQGVLGPLQIQTPERSLDLLVNRWLPYQVLACRVWARAGFYQVSGAYGFRDQLQDVGALCIARPDLARSHILLAASRQFAEGDVQHWWLPPSGKGVRTRIVDDRLWLPLIVAHYVATTGDTAILEERVPFLHGDALPDGQSDAFFAPSKSASAATLFEHCARAIDASLATGAHGLPLMGTGDWNDGMNRVGAGGKGESVWMAWFLCKVIGDFVPFAEERLDARVARWRDQVWALQLALETKAWDGGWYRRAFYDDGSPLGTAADTECRIESMAQSWAVISGAGDPERATRAMQAVRQQLVRANDGLVALFTEPFDAAPRDPGYIKGYPPGLRENGGQYTHGSLWALIAFAMLGDGDAVGELLEIFDPVRHADTADKAARYQVEPYVQCADVYSVAPHVGRGGWTWYSGSAGWTYRALVEWVLGVRLQGDRLRLAPCIPPRWQGYAFTYRRGASDYRIEVDNPGHVCGGVATLEVDGVALQDPDTGIALQDDGKAHRVHATLRT